MRRFAQPIHLEAAGNTSERRPGVSGWPVGQSGRCQAQVVERLLRVRGRAVARSAATAAVAGNVAAHHWPRWPSRG